MNRKVLIVASICLTAMGMSAPVFAQSPFVAPFSDAANAGTDAAKGIVQEQQQKYNIDPSFLTGAQDVQNSDYTNAYPPQDTGAQAAAPQAAPARKLVYKKPIEPPPEDGFYPVPATLPQLQGLEKMNKAKEETGMSFDIRRDALKSAAISYGARGGLAWKTYQIRKEIDKRARSLDKVYDFRSLLIAAPSGLLIEPPIISENLNAMLINDGGQQAAVADRLYYIVQNAKIVSTSRTWRTYLEREWGTIEPPPDILRPEDDKERKLWFELVAVGWEQGVEQADEIFHDDLNLLMADFQGMIRYRSLLAQGLVSPPYALQIDRGVTGGKDEMRIGDRAVQITGVPQLITGTDQWQPASR